MKTIQLKVEDSGFEILMNIIKNLKSGIIVDYTIKNDDVPFIEEVSEEENERYTKLLKNMSDDDRQISSKEFVNI